MPNQLTLYDEIEEDVDRDGSVVIEPSEEVGEDEDKIFQLGENLLCYFRLTQTYDRRIITLEREVDDMKGKVANSALMIELTTNTRNLSSVRARLEILRHKRDALRHLFMGTLKSKDPKRAHGDWAIRRGFWVVVSFPADDHREKDNGKKLHVGAFEKW